MKRSPHGMPDTGDPDAPLRALARCAELNWDPVEVLAGQYLINQRPDAPVQGWQTQAIGGWYLHACPSFPLSCHGTPSDDIEAVVLGVAVDPGGRIVDAATPLFGNAIAGGGAAVEAIGALAGRYIVLLRSGRTVQLFADPCCSIACFYDPEGRQAASCIGLLLRRGLRFAPGDPHRRRDRLASRAIYLFGRSCDRALSQLMANHALSLDSFEPARHWPPARMTFDQGDTSLDDIAAQIGDKLTRTLAALAGRFSTTLAITAGSDSRLLLACGANLLRQIDTFYVYDVNWSTSVDTMVAQQIAQRLGLPLLVDRTRNASAEPPMTREAADIYNAKTTLRSSFFVRRTDRRLIAALLRLPANDVYWRGGVAGMTRAFGWPRTRDAHGNDPDRLVKAILGATTEDPRVAYWREAADGWVQTLPEAARPWQYDLAHVEVRLPATTSLAFHTVTRTCFLNPFNDRHLIALTACIAPKRRKRMDLVKRIVAQRMPELADIPYFMDVLGRLRRGQPPT